MLCTPSTWRVSNFTSKSRWHTDWSPVALRRWLKVLRGHKTLSHHHHQPVPVTRASTLQCRRRPRPRRRQLRVIRAVYKSVTPGRDSYLSLIISIKGKLSISLTEHSEWGDTALGNELHFHYAEQRLCERLFVPRNRWLAVVLENFSIKLPRLIAGESELMGGRAKWGGCFSCHDVTRDRTDWCSFFPCIWCDTCDGCNVEADDTRFTSVVKRDNGINYTFINRIRFRLHVTDWGSFWIRSMV